MSARLVVHVQPRARATAVAGRHGDAIRIRLAAPPVDGAAGRRKSVVIEGLTADRAARLLLGSAP